MSIKWGHNPFSGMSHYSRKRQSSSLRLFTMAALSIQFEGASAGSASPPPDAHTAQYPKLNPVGVQLPHNLQQKYPN